LQRVSTANVDDVCRQGLFPDLLCRRLLLDQQEDVRPALQKFAEILLDTLPISFGIRTRGWDKEQLWILFVRKSDRFSIDRGGSSGSYLPPPMATKPFVSVHLTSSRIRALRAIVLIARRTDDRSRDIDEAIREQAISRLMALGIAEETIRLVSRYVPPGRADAVRSFGESLPPGLQAVSSSNCLLSVPALHISGPSLSKPA
jgi:hypothetical protein